MTEAKTSEVNNSNYCDLRIISFIGSNYKINMPVVLLSGEEYWGKFTDFNKAENLIYCTTLSKKLLVFIIHRVTPYNIIANCCCDYNEDEHLDECKNEEEYSSKLAIVNLTIHEIIDIFKFAHETQNETCMQLCLSYFNFDYNSYYIPHSNFNVFGNGIFISTDGKKLYSKYDPTGDKYTPITIDDIRADLNNNSLDTPNHINMETIYTLMKLCEVYSIEYKPLLQTIGFYLELNNKLQIETKCILHYTDMNKKLK